MQENNLGPELKKGESEYFFNQMEPFYKAMVIYVAALILACLSWVNSSDWLRRSGLALLILAFVIHSVGLGFRMWLEGRPPVTNLYSSAIFIGWGAALLGIILERMFKGGNQPRRLRPHRFLHPHHRPSSGSQRRHHGNVARCS